MIKAYTPLLTRGIVIAAADRPRNGKLNRTYSITMMNETTNQKHGVIICLMQDCEVGDWKNSRYRCWKPTSWTTSTSWPSSSSTPCCRTLQTHNPECCRSHCAWEEVLTLSLQIQREPVMLTLDPPPPPPLFCSCYFKNVTPQLWVTLTPYDDANIFVCTYECKNTDVHRYVCVWLCVCRSQLLWRRWWRQLRVISTVKAAEPINEDVRWVNAGEASGVTTDGSVSHLTPGGNWQTLNRGKIWYWNDQNSVLYMCKFQD